MTRALLAFALKEEFAPWRRRHHFRRVAFSGHHLYSALLGKTEVYVGLTGAGAPLADEFEGVAARLMPDFAMITGVAAGLKPEWRPGDLLAAQTVLGTRGEAPFPAASTLLESAIQCGARQAPALVSLPRIARTVEEKIRWSKAGDAADMESLPIIKRWSARGIPTLALRVILDPLETPLTCDFEAAMDARGQVRIARVVAQLARHSQLLPDFLRLARQSRRVLKILAGFWDRFFELPNLRIK